MYALSSYSDRRCYQFDFITGTVDFNGIKPILYKGAAVIIIGAAAQWIMNICNNRITYAVVRDIRQEAFEKIERLPLKYIDSHPYGDIVSRIIADADQFSDGLLMGFTQSVLAVFLQLQVH